MALVIFSPLGHQRQDMITTAKTKQVVSSQRFKEIVAANFILLFVYTGVTKLIEHDKFSTALFKSPLLHSYYNVVAFSIPIMELLTAGFLFTPGTRRFGLVLSLLLMTVFTIYIAYMIAFTPHLPCSCGGIISSLSWKAHLILDTILTLLAASAVFDNKIFIAINRGRRKPANRVGNSFNV